MTEEEKLERAKKKKESFRSKFVGAIPFIGCMGDVKVRSEFSKWVERAYDRFGAKLTVADVEKCVNQVRVASKDDAGIAEDLFRLNTQGYKTMEFAIDDYIKKPQYRPSVMDNAIKANSVSTEWKPASEVKF